MNKSSEQDITKLVDDRPQNMRQLIHSLEKIFKRPNSYPSTTSREEIARREGHHEVMSFIHRVTGIE
jgi:hypothetical protein